MLGQRIHEGDANRDWRRSIAVAASRVRADLAFAAIDVFIILAGYMFALGLRMLDPGVGDPVDFWADLIRMFPLIVGLHLLANVVMGAYGHVWEHASLGEARQVIVANGLAGAVLFVLLAGFREAFGVVIPYSVVVLGALVSLGGMGLVRFRSRLFSLHRQHGTSRLLVVGSGGAAAAFARQAPLLPGGGEVVGFVSDDGLAAGSIRRLAGLPILGTLDHLRDLVVEHRVDQVVVVGGGAERAREVVDRCLDIDVRLRILPGAEDVMLDRPTTLDARDIHLEDLLVRPPVTTDLGSVAALLKGKRVLVTGAGGSIGSEIARQVLQFEPAGMWALDRDESLLHEASLRWRGAGHPVLCDVRDRRKLLRVMHEIRPQVVFHAAALKHVPVLERFPEEAVLANVVGTRNLIEAGSRAGMERFVLISTDKAVDPSSVMGASKRAAEMLVQAGNERGDGCVYTAVRFGNVLGSRGSVVPTFIEQIKSGGPVTVTDPEMTRYFMTVDEAVQLVLQASALARGSEVFVLDMGEPVKIVDLARRLIRLAGLAPGRDIPVVFTGRRPGEKLSETLSTDPLKETAHPSIFEAAISAPTGARVAALVDDLAVAAEEASHDKVLELLGFLTVTTLGSGPVALDLEGDPLQEAESAWS